jgi:hypothetical protein
MTYLQALVVTGWLDDTLRYQVRTALAWDGEWAVVLYNEDGSYMGSPHSLSGSRHWTYSGCASMLYEVRI